jgi:membrane protein
LGFLLAVSLVLSAVLAALSDRLTGSATASLLLTVTNFAVSLALLTLLFSMLFKWLPDKQMVWQDVWLGGFITALMFNVGKSAIAWYIGTQGLESTFGAAASVVVLLIWVYYSAQILLFGAEITQVRARRHVASCGDEASHAASESCPQNFGR